MSGPRQPIELVVANGRKHLTKAEIEERRQRELQPCTDNITAPKYLTASEKKEFYKIAAQLGKQNIMSETDCGAVARYVSNQREYEKAFKDLQAAEKAKPKDADPKEEAKWKAEVARLDKRVDRYCKLAQKAEAALGMSPISRCRLVAPVVEEKPKENKYSKFVKDAAGK